MFADLIAQDRPNAIAEPYALKRFETGFLIDEHGAAGVAINNEQDDREEDRRDVTAGLPSLRAKR